MKVIFNFIKRRETALGALLCLAVGLRLLFTPGSLDNTDDVNFALSLDRFDLVHHRPHFPGYPLYVLSARAFRLVASPVLALSLPGILGAALMIAVIHRALRERPVAAWLAAVLLTTAPTLVVTAASPGSDGLALALTAVAFAWPFAGGSWRASGAWLGLALGVRASYAPFALSLLFLGRKRDVLIGLSLAVAAWAVPLAILVGPATLFHEAISHVNGHFHSWGGSVATSQLTLLERALVLAHHSLSGLVPLLVVALLLRRPPPREIWIVAMPYLLWVWLAQNPDHARHFAPLTAIVCVALALSLEAREWTVAAAALSAILAVAQIEQPHPWRQSAVAWVGEHVGLERVVVAGTHLPRVAQFYAPELRIEPAVDGADVERIAQKAAPGVRLLVASEVSDLQRPGLKLHELAHFGAARLFEVATP